MNKKTLTSIRKSRTMHLIDIENLCMAANPTFEQVAEARRSYMELVNPGEHDQFLVTVSSRHNLAAAAFGWSGADLKCREGHDGADYLLAEAILEGQLEDRFDQVVIASGDGGLAPFVQKLTRLLKEVIVVSQPTAIAFAMRMSGARVRYLTPEFALAA
jgi:hypothetical protein